MPTFRVGFQAIHINPGDRWRHHTKLQRIVYRLSISARACPAANVLFELFKSRLNFPASPIILDDLCHGKRQVSHSKFVLHVLISSQQGKSFSSSSGDQKPASYFELIRVFFVPHRQHLWIWWGRRRSGAVGWCSRGSVANIHKEQSRTYPRAQLSW